MSKLEEGFATLARKLQEAALALSHSDLRRGLQDTLSEYTKVQPGGTCPICSHTFGSGYPSAEFTCCYCHVVDVFGTTDAGDVVYSAGGELYRARYSTSMDGETRKHTIDFAGAVDVLPRTVYDLEVDEAAREARKAKRKASTAAAIAGEGELTETDLITDATEIDVREGAVRSDGTALLKLIGPGWGSSGYYSPEMLKRDGPKLFTKGTHTYWDHQTDAEEAEKPEDSLERLAGALVEDCAWHDNGPKGPGLYAPALVEPSKRETLNAVAPYIGMSINARGVSKEGFAEGRRGPIIEKLTVAKSVDYVTRPGAKGAIVQLFESARTKRAPQPTNQPERETEEPMNEAEKKALLDRMAAIEASNAQLKAENDRLRERHAITDAGSYVDTVLGNYRVASAIKARVKRRVLESDLPLTEAKAIDNAKLKTIVEAELNDEVQYLERVAPTGRVEGLGASAAPLETDPTKLAESDRKFEEKTLGALADIFIPDSDPERAKRMRETFSNGRAN